MTADLPLYKSEIIIFLNAFFVQKKKDLQKIHPLGAEALEKIQHFALQGKFLRGALVLTIYRFFHQSLSQDAIKAAGAIELFQSSFLIHDDIMDQDETRRGQKSIYKQYADTLSGTNPQQATHFGQSMGISVGDISFFLAFEILSSLKHKNTLPLLQIISQELQKVGVAQMQDVAQGASKKDPSLEQILSLYTYKTARYTFSLPFVVGAILGGADRKFITSLEKMGENLGILFQIKDDELGMFGDKEKTGKPIGSDIKENKKTLFHYYLFQKADFETKNRLSKIFENSSLSASDLAYVRECIEKTGVKEIIENQMNQLQKKTVLQIQDLSLSKGDKKTLLNLLTFTLQRTS